MTRQRRRRQRYSRCRSSTSRDRGPRGKRPSPVAMETRSASLSAWRRAWADEPSSHGCSRRSHSPPRRLGRCVDRRLEQGGFHAALDDRPQQAPSHHRRQKAFPACARRSCRHGGIRPKLKGKAKELLASGVERLSLLQEQLYAQDRWALRHLPGDGRRRQRQHHRARDVGYQPQGCQVYSFKAPSEEELDHDFLWRGVRLPERGRIGISTARTTRRRSSYASTPSCSLQRLPHARRQEDLGCVADIEALERHLARNGTAVCKFFRTSQGRAASPFSAPRRPTEELEVLDCRPARA